MNAGSIAPEAICYNSPWRALADGSEHPRHYVKLGGKEITELFATGSFTLPDHFIPESVREWRRKQEAAAEIIAAEQDRLLEAMNAG